MGKGDIKSKKGKRWVGSFGKSRPHKIKAKTAAAPVAAKAVAEVAAPAEKKAKKPAAKKEA